MVPEPPYHGGNTFPHHAGAAARTGHPCRPSDRPPLHDMNLITTARNQAGI